jgi:polyhydroxyalkanoate synthesis repressor PhaR
MPSRRSAPAKEAEAASQGPRTLKKYPNRRLYDTRSSSYITLADVKRMVLAGEDFEVRDAKTGEDLTRSILLQIILEEESGGVPMFSTPMLAQIIRFYGHSMQGAMGTMLERNLQAFADMQSQLVSGQAPLMQNLMAGYLEQSRAMFEKMQEQMAQAGTLFPGFPPGKR